MKVKLGYLLAGVLSIGLLQSCGAVKDSAEEEAEAILDAGDEDGDEGGDEDDDEDGDEDGDEGAANYSPQGILIQKLYNGEDQVGQYCYALEAANATFAGTVAGQIGTGIAAEVEGVEAAHFTWLAGESCEDFAGDEDAGLAPMGDLIAVCTDSVMDENLAGLGAVKIYADSYLTALRLDSGASRSCEYPDIPEDAPNTVGVYLSTNANPTAEDAIVTCQEITNESAPVLAATLEAITLGLPEGQNLVGTNDESCNKEISEALPFAFTEVARCSDASIPATLEAYGLSSSSVKFVVQDYQIAFGAEFGLDAFEGSSYDCEAESQLELTAASFLVRQDNFDLNTGNAGQDTVVDGEICVDIAYEKAWVVDFLAGALNQIAAAIPDQVGSPALSPVSCEDEGRLADLSAYSESQKTACAVTGLPPSAALATLNGTSTNADGAGLVTCP